MPESFRPGADMPRWSLAVSFSVACMLPFALAVPPDAEKGAVPPANADAEQAAQRAQVDPGLKVELWAAEPMLKNPSAFAFDEQGRCYVTEANRYQHGVPDTRGHMYWLDEDLAAKTVDDRVAMYKKHRFSGSPKVEDRVMVLWDSAGKGRADRSEVFSGGYSRPQDGLAAGVLARKGDVYFACIPELYKLRDTTGDNKADHKESLSSGYGVRVQFVGHDLHGLRMGPDGKLYFSIGDRGFTVVTKEGKTLSNPDSGAVLRCDPDGANLEIVHVGLRNPQELAFDDLGNLFTYDNNSDSGDAARWVQVVEGGDSGWRCGYQYGTLMHHSDVPQGNRGPFNTEKVWHLPGPDGGPPAYVVPPLAHFGNGPAGLTHYPGVGLADQYRDHFFACDFTASPANSVIWALAVKPKGASFEVVNRRPFVRNAVPTDCDFGPDGAFYWSDWVGGWDLPNKGRIFRLTDPEAMKNPVVEESRKLLAEGFEKKKNQELLPLLNHPHQLIRQEAQFELARRLAGRPPGSGMGFLNKVAEYATTTSEKLGKLHALWFFGMVDQKPNDAVNLSSDARRKSSVIDPVVKLLADPDADVRIQAAKVYGRLWKVDPKVLIPLFSDSDLAVRAAAVESFGSLTGPDGIDAILGVLKANDNQDAYLRHAAVVALAKLGQPPVPVPSEFDTPAVRLGVVLALRRLKSPKLAEFLGTAADPVAVEAARAVYDEQVEPSFPKLAELADSPGLPEPTAYRALAANFYLGTPENARRLAEYAARAGEPGHLRALAVKFLSDWAKPPRRDPIMGGRYSRPERPRTDAAGPLAAVFPKLLSGSDELRKQAVQAVTRLELREIAPQMAKVAADDREPADVRAEAVYALEALQAKELTEVLGVAKRSDQPRLRAAAVVVAARANPTTAGKELPVILENPTASLAERQAALAALGELRDSPEATRVLAEWLDKYLADEVPVELKLDVLEAARARSEVRGPQAATFRDKLRAIDRAARDAEMSDPLARHRETLSGGDAEKGRRIFLENAAVYCQRCHRLDGQGGDVGPPLNGIGKRHDREYLLAAIVLPSRDIAEGYQSVILEMADGRTLSGVLRSKNAKEYTLIQADGTTFVVPADEVDAERPDKSAMPDDLHKKLGKRELRDLVEFLANLKEEWKN